MWSLSLLVGILAHELPSTSVTMDPSTRLVIWGTRHGNRNPAQFYSKEISGWGQEGDMELTSMGKRQSYGLGRSLRQFVGSSLIDVNYLPSQAKFYSSSASRCQTTLQAALAGIYEPQGWADWNTAKFDNWSPVPYIIDDHILRMYSMDEQACPNNNQVWGPIDRDALPELNALKNEHQYILEYMSNQTGWGPSISNMADMADNLIQIDLYKAAYPSWIENPSLPGYDKERIIREIMKFAENHQIMCAEYAPCRDLMGGVWLNDVIQTIRKAQTGNGPKMIGYSSHTEITLAVMKLLGIDRDELTTSAGFVIEYRNTLTNGDEVRLLNHDPNPIDEHVIYQAVYSPELAGLASVDGWMNVVDFVAVIQKYAISDWKQACSIQN